MSEDDMKVWMRGFPAPLVSFPATSTSFSRPLLLQFRHFWHFISALSPHSSSELFYILITKRQNSIRLKKIVAEQGDALLQQNQQSKQCLELSYNSLVSVH